MSDKDDEINSAPQSDHYETFFCPNGEHIHVILFDERGKCICTATFREEQLRSLAEEAREHRLRAAGAAPRALS